MKPNKQEFDTHLYKDKQEYATELDNDQEDERET